MNDKIKDCASAETGLTMREALEFYANEWRTNGDGDTGTPGLSRTWREPTDALMQDEGQKARAALAKLGER